MNVIVNDQDEVFAGWEPISGGKRYSATFVKPTPTEPVSAMVYENEGDAHAVAKELILAGCRVEVAGLVVGDGRATHQVLRHSTDGSDCARMFKGSAKQCDQWVADNRDHYPKSKFSVALL